MSQRSRLLSSSSKGSKQNKHGHRVSLPTDRHPIMALKANDKVLEKRIQRENSGGFIF